MPALVWILLPLFVAAGSALLTACILHAAHEMAIARERQALIEARVQLADCNQIAEQKVRAAEEAARRQALDDFLGEIRVEKRHYLHESKTANQARKSLVLEERLCFRNLPLSDWVRREMVLDESGEITSVSEPAPALVMAFPASGALPAAPSEPPPERVAARRRVR